MQQSDVHSLFQKPPQQQDASQFGPAERDSNPAVSPEPQPQSQSSEGHQVIESLFRDLAPQGASQPSPSNIPIPVNSPPESVISTASNVDRTQTLLSLLGTVSVGQQPAPRDSPPVTLGPNTQPLGPSPNQSGKLLLDQIVGGNLFPSQPSQPSISQPTTSIPSQSQPPVQHQAPAVQPTMPASHSQPPSGGHNLGFAPVHSGHMSDREVAAEQQRKNLFDFINSPYEVLQSGQHPSQLYPIAPQQQNQNTNPIPSQAAPTITKKKPVPAYDPNPNSGSRHASPQTSPRPAQLQRRHTPSPDPLQYNPYPAPLAPEQEPYTESLNPEPTIPISQSAPQGMESAEESGAVFNAAPQPFGVPHGPLPPIPVQRQSPISQQKALQQVQQPLPSPPTRHALPPGPSQRQSPPPGQRPQDYVQQQVQGQRGRGSPASIRQNSQSTQGGGAGGREGAGSPAGSGTGPAASTNSKRSSKQQSSSGYASPGQQQQQRNGRPPQASPQGHSFVTIDVSLPLASTLASPDIVNITPIALLKLEPTYTQGTTIGVANFIAYSMSRGRIRLIGRQTGDRNLLKLPASFPAHAQVQDMVISGTKLACVSSDGGLVVWDVPHDIENDTSNTPNSASTIVLHVPPQAEGAGFKVVKWHPKQPGLLAVASEDKIYLLHIDEAQQVFGGEGVSHEELSRVSTVFTVPSSLVSFTFDVPQVAIASISVDSTVTLWSINDKLPFWSGRVYGEGIPSSIDFIDGGLVIGRHQGNIIQLLPAMSTNVLSTIRFVLGQPGSSGNKASVDNPEAMFGHLCYDPATRVLWVASSARNSLFAVKIGVDSGSSMEPSTPSTRPTFDQILEFPCSMPSINLTVVAAESTEEGGGYLRDPDLVVSAFSVHSGGVDQINITQAAYDNAAVTATSKLPMVTYGPAPVDRAERRTSSQSQQAIQAMAPATAAPVAAASHSMPPAFRQEYQPPAPVQYVPPPQQSSTPNVPSYHMYQRSQTPVDDPYGLVPEPTPSAISNAPVQPPQQAQTQVAPPKSRAKEQANQTGGKQVWKGSPSTVPSEPVGRIDQEALQSNMTKELRKVEDNLNTKIGRLIVKELDKQHARLEDVRHADQTAEFERQEKILKLISTELTKNTTRVVESAVKNVIQNAVLPALETMTRAEVKTALSQQIAKGLSDSMKQTLPVEIEKLLLRPDVSNNVARTFSAAIVPAVERNVKDSINKVLVPAYTQATSDMHQALSREIHGEILNLKKEVVTWQSDALKGTETLVRDLESSVRTLSEQVKALSAQVAASTAAAAAAAKSSPRTKVIEPTPDYSQVRQPQVPTPQNGSSSFVPSYSSPSGWINPTMPQIQQPLGPPPNQQQAMVSPPPQQIAPQPTEDWDETFLSTLGMHDQKKLRELLSRASPDVVMPTNQLSPLSQTVLLALIHRLALSLTEVSPADDAFKSSIWWLQRSAYALNPQDPVIAPYIGRVLQTAVSTLNTTAQRLSVIPGQPSLTEATNMISQIQQSLSNLMT